MGTIETPIIIVNNEPPIIAVALIFCVKAAVQKYSAFLSEWFSVVSTHKKKTHATIKTVYKTNLFFEPSLL